MDDHLGLDPGFAKPRRMRAGKQPPPIMYEYAHLIYCKLG